ncbi:MAG TPA: Lrp/AsnC family transcriptional regulator [Actinocrinis sp.]|nr:Lrp/AsnC family transcriptional regulator [Actinocrinis sp.]
MDAVDRMLVDALRTNGRATYAELARLVGLSGPTVTDRINRLEQNGVISGYRATISPPAVGLGVTALIGILLSDAADLEDVGRRLKDVVEIEDCWFVAGEESYLIKVRAANPAGLEKIIGKVNRIRGVARTRTTVALSTKWEGRQPPLGSALTGGAESA